MIMNIIMAAISIIAWATAMVTILIIMVTTPMVTRIMVVILRLISD